MPFEVRGEEKTVDIGDTTYHLIRASKDGNCLFHAAGHALVVAGKVHAALASHVLLRAQVIVYLTAHAKDLSPLGLKLREGMGIAGNQQDVVSVAQGNAIDRRIEFLGGLRNWGDEACITALEQLYDVEALVFNDVGVAQVDGVTFYVRSHARDTKIRLCIRFRGHIPVHYDVYLADHNALRDGDNLVVEVVQKGGEVSQSAKEPWAYHMDPKGLKLFCPAIGPRQFAHSRLVLDGLAKKAKPKPLLISVALGDQPNVVLKPAPVVAVHVRNRADKAELVSMSFSIATDPELLAKGVREKLILPLMRVDKQCVNLLDLSQTDLFIDIETGKAEPPVVVYLRLYRRAFGREGANIPNSGLLDEMEIDLTKLKSKGEVLKDRLRFTLEGAVIPLSMLKLMGWTASPFQIVVSSDRSFAVEDSAWTHVHVPSETDILHAEYFARVPVAMLDDSPTSLADLGIKAVVADLANPTMDVKPKGREVYAMPALKETALGQLLNATALGGINWNTNSYLAEVEPGKWYASTSWASMVSLKRDEKSGKYCLNALYWSGNRKAFVANRADLAAPGQRALGDGVALADRVLQRVTAVRAAIGSAYSINMGSTASILFPTIRAEQVYDAMYYYTASQREEHDLLALFKQRYNVARQQILDLNANVESRDFLLGLKHDVRQLLLTAFRNDAAPLLQLGNVEACQILCDTFYRALTAHKAGLLQKGLELDFEEVEGVKDFDLASGERLKAGADWKRHVFDPPLELTFAVTAGISSCAGGITVSNEKEGPEYVFMWHLDASLSIPLIAEMGRIWPKGKEPPTFRTLALVTPSLWELNKYRPDNLYLPSVAAESQGLFLARSSHWYGEQPVVAGCELFGVDCRAKGQVDLVFNYGIDMRTEPLGIWRGLTAASEDAPSVLAHFQQGLFGTYRYNKGDPKTEVELATYMLPVAGQDRDAIAAIKLHKRETNNKSCVIPNMCAATIETALGKALPLLELPRIYAADKGDWELAHSHKPAKWLPGSRK